MTYTTGIVRRIDELGRVVIPKEIRKTMHIKEGEALEVSVGDDALILKKYSPAKTMEKLATEYAEALKNNTGYACLVCDLDEFFVACGKPEFKGKRISRALETFLRNRKSGFFRSENAFSIVPGERNGDVAIAPVVCDGDVEGGIVLLSEKTMSGSDMLVRMLDVGASFFAKQME